MRTPDRSINPLATVALVALTCAPLLLLVSAGEVLAQGGPALVKVAPITQKQVAAGQSFVGAVMPVRRSVIGSAVAGRIVEFPHNEGDYVEKGEVLARVLTGTIEIELAQAKAELKMREAQLAESVTSFPAEKQQVDARMAATKARMRHADAKLKRVQELRQRKSASEEAYDEAEAAFLEAQAAFLEAEAARKRIFDGPREQKIAEMQAQVDAQREAVRYFEDRIEKYTIRAYFSGYITAEHTEVGHWIKDGESVLEVSELGAVDVRVNVPEDHLADLEVGATVRVEVPATRAKSFFGEVAAIVPQADLKARSFPVLVRVKNTETAASASPGKQVVPELKAGMTARAILPVGRLRDTLLVSKDAIVLGGRAPVVFVVDGDPQDRTRGTVRLVPVELGAAIGGEIQVVSLSPEAPLKEGDLLVIEGNERLRPGQPVTFGPPASNARAAKE